MTVNSLFDRLNAGEHNSKKLGIKIEKAYNGCGARLAFITPLGRSYLSESLELTDGECEYPLAAALLDGPGILYVQLLLYRGEEYICKSQVMEYPVFQSVSAENAAPPDKNGIIDPDDIYEKFLLHAHDDIYLRKNQVDALLASKADINRVYSAGSDRENYLNDTLDCIASYLVHETDCDCVTVPAGHDMFSAVYNDTGRSYLSLYGQGSEPFTWNERTEDGYHKMYCNCSGFLSLITKCRPYAASPYKKAFDMLDCHIAGNGCSVFSPEKSYSVNDTVLYLGDVYKCVHDAPAGSFDRAKWELQTVPEFSYKYMRYSADKVYDAGEYVLNDGALYMCTQAVRGEEWDDGKWQFIRDGLTVKEAVLRAFASETGNIHEKPYTLDFKNLIYTYYMAFIQDHGGNPLKSILKRSPVGTSYGLTEVSSEEDLALIEDGDLLFFSRPGSRNYKKISHCGYYLSSLDKLNEIGASKYNGAVFRAIEHSDNSGGEWGYVVDCAASYPANSGRNTIRIMTLKGMMNNSDPSNPYCECFYSKPYSNPFNSTKASRLLSFVSTSDDRLWFGNRISNKFVTDPDAVPYGSYWLQPGDGKAHMHTVTAASLGAEGYLLARLLPHGLDYADYPEDTLDIDHIQNGVYRCDRYELAERLTDGNGAPCLPDDMTESEKVFMLVQTGGIEELEEKRSRYGVQLIFPSLATNTVIYMRSRNEGYYDGDGNITNSGNWGEWKKIVTLDGLLGSVTEHVIDNLPGATVSSAGVVKVGNGLSVEDGVLSADIVPEGEWVAMNVGVAGVRLASGVDLDRIANGVWRCDSSDIAASVLNKPPVLTSDLRAFTVVQYGAINAVSSGARYGVQIFTSNPSGGMTEIFFRQRGYSGGWQQWQCVGQSNTVSVPGGTATLCLKPNAQYVISSPVSRLDITFDMDGTDKCNECGIVFTAGDNITVNVPSNVVWSGAIPVWAPNTKYALSFMSAGTEYIGVWSVIR